MNWFIQNVDQVLHVNLSISQIILPLGISFYTFEQIAFLVDTWSSKARQYSFLDYCLFVTFFPRFIAGPILRHNEFLPQVEKITTFKLRLDNLSIGISIFCFGLFKKIFIADQVALIADPVFNVANQGHLLGAVETWMGLLAYALQIYFDFSSYSDMAIGVARIFGIVLPMNFNSPYKAINVSDFWTRWNISLSRFLRDYLYIPLGGNRRGKVRQYFNLMVTMLLGGLWHGASWAFLIWGGLHGVYLMIHHFWLFLRSKFHFPVLFPGKIWAQAITFLAVILAWVPFRVQSVLGVKTIYRSLFNLHGRHFSLDHLIELLILMAIVFCAPNVMQIFKGAHSVLESESLQNFRPRFLAWKPSVTWGFIIAFICMVSFFYLDHAKPFIYFDF